MHTNSSGYAALMAILVISFSLLSVSLIASFESMTNLLNVLAREEKEISFNLAEVCLDQAIVRILQNPSWRPHPPGEQIEIESNFCTITSVQYVGSHIKIETQGEEGESFTLLKVLFNPDELAIISLEEG